MGVRLLRISTGFSLQDDAAAIENNQVMTAEPQS
jgi:hypothetical protein